MIINDQTNIQDSSLLENLIRYSEIKQQISECPDDEIIIDLSRIRFAFPLFLNLLLLTRDKDKRIRFENETSYLKAISFPDALSVAETELKNISKTYIPLIADMPNNENSSTSSVTNRIISLINRTVDIPKSVSMGIHYMLQELIDNITEHSLAEKFYVLSQAYPKKKVIDICIADNGKGFRQSYKRAGYNVRNDNQAIQMMASAISSKDRPENESRGYGLFTSRKMTTEGLSGEFLCISGKAAYAKLKDKEYILNLPSWNTIGTVVALRIKYDNEKFSIYNFLEY